MAEVLPEKFVSPAYTAVMSCIPTAVKLVVMLAVAAAESWDEPSDVEPS
jgi:hypothetical protein